MKSTHLKLLSAGIGAGALIAMGAIGVTFSNVSAAEPEPAEPGPITTSEVTTGETSTESTAPTELETPAATPEVTTTPVFAET